MKPTYRFNHKPSIACRVAKWQVTKREAKANLAEGLTVMSVVTFALAIIFLVSGLMMKDLLNIIASILSTFSATFLFLVGGYNELIAREYVKKNSNQWVEREPH